MGATGFVNPFPNSKVAPGTSFGSGSRMLLYIAFSARVSPKMPLLLTELRGVVRSRWFWPKTPQLLSEVLPQTSGT